MISEKIKWRIGNTDGNISVIYKDLCGDKYYNVGNCDMFKSAGIIKLLVLIEVFKQINNKKLKKDDIYILKRKDKSESIGVISSLHEGIELTIEDLYRLMICVSDNSAVNILIDILGLKEINKTLQDIGLEKTCINRKLFDKTSQKKGIENYFSMQEIGDIITKLYYGQIITRKHSEEILNILKTQQTGSIFKHHFGEALEIAHQTGEDDGILHDVGIVFAHKPFILCLASSDLNIKNAESILRDITLMCYKDSQGIV